MTQPIRILLVDDHTLVRKGIGALMEPREDIVVIGEASNGAEAGLKAREQKPDIILMDLVMPKVNGIEAIRTIKEENDQARILVLTSFAEDDKVLAAIKAGALGYLLKDSMPQELIQAIQDVYQGKPSLSPVIASKLMSELYQSSKWPSNEEPLTEREEEVLELIALGYSNAEISQKLQISDRTVGTHVSNILSKLHVANRTQAAILAMKRSRGD
ncbi:MAG: DNA-binding response regulator [Chloroflexota bacterium]|nr:MAG: DNA-binding response regulator [Chloroflexota bacterium]